MTDEAIRRVIRPDGDQSAVEVLARGDIDGDGDQDAVARAHECGASCGSTMFLVISAGSTPTLVDGGTHGVFAPWYIGGGATQTSVSTVTIGRNMITITGSGLCGDALDAVVIDEAAVAWPCDFDADDYGSVQRTATYAYVTGAVQPVSIDPPLD